jgi:hypothetical protein
MEIGEAMSPRPTREERGGFSISTGDVVRFMRAVRRISNGCYPSCEMKARGLGAKARNNGAGASDVHWIILGSMGVLSIIKECTNFKIIKKFEV